MKAFILLCLAAVAIAEPEADPQFLYSGYPYAGYSAYSAYSPYTYAAYSPYTYSAGVHYIGKREAEAEADPQLLYTAGASWAAPWVNSYSYNALTYAAAPVAAAVATPAVYSAAPVAAAVAAPAVYTTPVAATVATPAVYAAAPAIVAKPASYYANSGGAVHIVKREAEAEAEADPQLLYTAGAPWINSYSYNALTYAAAPVAAAVATPAVYSAAPVAAAVAAPAVYTTPVAATVATPAVYAAAPAIVAKPASYYANSGGAVHIVKREAEAEPQYVYSGYPYAAYSSYYPYTYSSYAGAYSYPYLF